MLYQLIRNHCEALSLYIFLIVVTVTLLLFCAILETQSLLKDSKTFAGRVSNAIIIFTFFVCSLLTYWTPVNNTLLFNGSLFLNKYSSIFTNLLIISCICFFVINQFYIQNQKNYKFETNIIFLLAIIGLLFMLISNDFLILYLAIELQSLCFYVLVVSGSKSSKSSEASLKYFILGSVATGFILLGISLIYLTLGSINFLEIAFILKNLNPCSSDILIFLFTFFGILFIFAGLFFKTGIAPYHIWLPDVYEGAPLNVTLFFSTIPKLVYIALLTKLYFFVFIDCAELTKHIFMFSAFASIGVGTFFTLQQKKTRRFLAYSSIGHVGYILIGFLPSNEWGQESVILYLLVYLVMTINIWTILLSIQKNNGSYRYLTDFNGIFKKNPLLAIIIILNLLSMAGIPPLAGFFSKVSIISASFNSELWGCILIVLLGSLVSTYYYVKFIKTLILDPSVNTMSSTCLPQISKLNALIIILSFEFILLFPLFSSPLLRLIQKTTLSFIL